MEINISYETLFELLRREKGRDEIQKLDSSFVEDVNQYLKEKMVLLESDKTNIVQNPAEAERIQAQVDNTKKIVKELYERRERKILSMALYKSRIPATKINTDNLLTFERKLLGRLIVVLSEAKTDATKQLFDLRRMDFDAASPPKEESAEGAGTTSRITMPTKEPAEIEEEKLKAVEFLEDVAQFIGPNLEPIGPFSKGDKAELPPEIAKILVDKGQAKTC